jgi:hypothetical protein
MSKDTQTEVVELIQDQQTEGQMTVQELAVSSTPVIGRPFASDGSSQLSPAWPKTAGNTYDHSDRDLVGN